ncbi:MAG: hypothetical protein AAGI49_11240 [Bacteroidota bacterium]
MEKIIIFDTSILCVWLQIPNFERCGNDEDFWDYERIDKKIEEELKNNVTFVLPLATIIETGNHISQSSGNRYELAKKFSALLSKSVDNEYPWAAFSEQGELWTDQRMKQLAENFPDLAIQSLSLGDAMIKDIAEYYAGFGRYAIEIFTGDQGLKAYEPMKPLKIPRRRK